MEFYSPVLITHCKDRRQTWAAVDTLIHLLRCHILFNGNHARIYQNTMHTIIIQTRALSAPAACMLESHERMLGVELHASSPHPQRPVEKEAGLIKAFCSCLGSVEVLCQQRRISINYHYTLLHFHNHQLVRLVFAPVDRHDFTSL